jgi:hypothetical protein
VDIGTETIKVMAAKETRQLEKKWRREMIVRGMPTLLMEKSLYDS